MAFAASPGAPAEAPLTYLLQDEGKWFPLAQFPVATRRINELMPRLLAALQGSPPLRGMLTSVAFLDTLAEDVMVVTLVYKGEGRLDDAWLSAATATAAALGVHFVGRCRGGSVVVGRNHVIERLTLRDGRTLLYKQVGIEDGGSGVGRRSRRTSTNRTSRHGVLSCVSLSAACVVQVEGNFSNPNAKGNAATMNFLSSCAGDIMARRAARGESRCVCLVSVCLVSGIAPSMRPFVQSGAADWLRAVLGVQRMAPVLTLVLLSVPWWRTQAMAPRCPCWSCFAATGTTRWR